MMDNCPLVTVIVPVYNTALYLKACFASISNQTYRKLEIIAVDDGSTDGSSELLDEISSVDPRIKVIHQENSGVSAARNTGISLASGEYIVFADSDDIMGSKNIEYLVEAEIQSRAQLCVSTQFLCFTSDKELCKRKNTLDLFSVQESDAPILKLSSSACGILYLTELIRKHRIMFDIKLHNKEDGLFNAEYQLYVSKYAVVTGPITFYRQRKGSITTRCVDLVWEVESLCLVISSFQEVCCRRNKINNREAILNQRIWVNGFYDTFSRLDRIQQFKCRKLKHDRKILSVLRSELSVAEKIKECILRSSIVDNNYVYPRLIHIRRLLND